MIATKSNSKRDENDTPSETKSIMPSPPLTKPQRMAYRIGRGEQGVLTFEPYKSLTLPHWRFRTPCIARASSSKIHSMFETYGSAHDFIGMDMCRKFLQMGMTRAKRYANHAGGRKYDAVSGKQLERSKGHQGQREKEEASRIFRELWERCKENEEYGRLKEEFVAEQKAWDRERREAGLEIENRCVGGVK